ncbi:histidine phosphatase family protein [Cellulomonas xiejunii]|uniref:histidine phosphatase family protein n=1 Tax=Cellulomonas xiejunii TaxID=2968083 RepID=UPI001D0E9F00|nr:histidine phosphatase family protein [Cellulomonas xiejunii]MCC2316270.1 histidine phosphatase family protein [Cellulomonas xiejunii]
MTQRLLLWRHARTAYNSQARLQGQIDIPLDEVGHWQARTSAARLAVRHRPARIVASDLTRTVETATYLSRALDVPVELDPRLRERAFGAWEGLTGQEIEVGWPGEFTAWRAGGDPAGVGAESRADVAARVSAAVRDHVARTPGRGDVVIVSHGAALGSLVAELLGQTPAWRGLVGMHNAHWAEMTTSGPDVEPAWRLLGYNIGPTDASSDWNAGPDPEPAERDADDATRDPD